MKTNSGKTTNASFGVFKHICWNGNFSLNQFYKVIIENGEIFIIIQLFPFFFSALINNALATV